MNDIVNYMTAFIDGSKASIIAITKKNPVHNVISYEHGNFTVSCTLKNFEQCSFTDRQTLFTDRSIWHDRTTCTDISPGAIGKHNNGHGIMGKLLPAILD